MGFPLAKSPTTFGDLRLPKLLTRVATQKSNLDKALGTDLVFL